jgi:ArsR family transcriptional regulator
MLVMGLMTKNTLSTQEKRVVYAMQLLGDSTRFKIFKLLSSSEELCVSEIAEKLDISPSAVSQHFRNFEMIGLVEKERMGQKICYVLKEDDQLVKELKKVTKL